MNSIDIKQIGGIILLIVLIPTLLNFTLLAFHIFVDPTNPTNIEDGVNIAANEAIPWWLGIFDALAKIPGEIGTFILIGFVFFLKLTRTF